jgi:hypothetical protein
LAELENEAMKRWGILKMNKTRRDYAEDARRTFNRLTKGVSCQCEIDPKIIYNHWASNWSNKPDDLNPDDANIFLYQKKDNYILKTKAAFWEQIRDWDKMRQIIKYKGNLSAPGMDRLTYLILKLDEEGAAKTICLLMEMMIRTECCPDIWKEAKTILIPKPVNNEKEREDPGNWRPITLTSVIYRIIMCRISRFFQSKKNFKYLLDPFQKGFKKRIEGCPEHVAILN